MIIVYPIPEGTSCDYCTAPATLVNRYRNVYCCSYHGNMWNNLIHATDPEWMDLLMLVTEANGNS